jgi:hypothetical protein
MLPNVLIAVVNIYRRNLIKELITKKLDINTLCNFFKMNFEVLMIFLVNLMFSKNRNRENSS